MIQKNKASLLYNRRTDKGDELYCLTSSVTQSGLNNTQTE